MIWMTYKCRVEQGHHAKWALLRSMANYPTFSAFFLVLGAIAGRLGRRLIGGADD
jgi:hypothetical protein